MFRRQFILSPEHFLPNQNWSSFSIGNNLNLSIHCDLPYILETDNKITIVLIGLAFDPFFPEKEESDIVHSMILKSSDISSVINCTKHLSGRWVIIFQNHRKTFLFTDPCGFRQVFYHYDGKNTRCASQPELINACHTLPENNDENILELMLNPDFHLPESAWLGNSTIYQDCMHLMPNHYLDVNNNTQMRFFPAGDLTKKGIPEIVSTASAILRGTMASITRKHSIILPLSTAGWDSRVLLAPTTKEISGKIEYFIDRNGILRNDHPDIWVPSKIAEKLHLRFVINNSLEQLPGWFVHKLSRSVTCSRVLTKTQIFYNNYKTDEKRININGNGSEICRSYYDKFYKGDGEDISSSDLASIFGYNKLSSYALLELNQWRASLGLDKIEGINIFDMLYWEQRLGNWAALAFAEQDMVVEEVSPFNNRLLIETLLSSDRKLRADPDYKIYYELIKNMWPETLLYPINPRPFISNLKYKIRLLLPEPVLSLRKKILGIKKIGSLSRTNH